MTTNKITKYRGLLGLTQQELANELGISLKSYWSREKGEIPFKNEEMMKIKNKIKKEIPDITIDDIFFSQ